MTISNGRVYVARIFHNFFHSGCGDDVDDGVSGLDLPRTLEIVNIYIQDDASSY